MKNYSATNNPHTHVIGAFAILFIGYLLGIRFENIYINKILGLVLYFFPIYVLVLVARTKFEKKFIKPALVTLLTLVSIGSLLPISFNLLTLASIKNGADPSFEEIRSMDVGPTKVVTYRTGGGATVDFGTTVRSEKHVLHGVYIKHDLIHIYHASDIDLSVMEPDSIRVDSIKFTSARRQAEYMSDNPQVIKGEVIKVN